MSKTPILLEEGLESQDVFIIQNPSSETHGQSSIRLLMTKPSSLPAYDLYPNCSTCTCKDKKYLNLHIINMGVYTL